MSAAPILRYMGTDIFLQGKPTAPRNISAIRAEIWGQMKPQCLAPNAAMMVLEAKVMPKLFAAASVYHLTATIQSADDALLVWCWKHVTGTSRHAHTESLWGPWRDGCMGLRWSGHSWQVAVARVGTPGGVGNEQLLAGRRGPTWRSATHVAQTQSVEFLFWDRKSWHDSQRC